jgi:Lrp/AsnC family transcriptional regulator for asnA, asnC and gidA
MSKFRLDEVDHQILDMLIDNTSFTDIAKIINFCWDRSR